MTNSVENYITVSQYAEYIGKTTAHVYHLISAGVLPVHTFSRGKMNGRLIEKPTDYDEWYARNGKKEEN